MAVDQPISCIGLLRMSGSDVGSGVSATCMWSWRLAADRTGSCSRGCTTMSERSQGRPPPDREAGAAFSGGCGRAIAVAENKLNSISRRLRKRLRPTGDPFRPSSLYDVLLSLSRGSCSRPATTSSLSRHHRNGYAAHQFKSATLNGDLRRKGTDARQAPGSTDSIAEVGITCGPILSRVTREAGAFFDVCWALTLTSTILFVGYSLDDPDIQLVLRAVGQRVLGQKPFYMLANLRRRRESPCLGLASASRFLRVYSRPARTGGDESPAKWLARFYPCAKRPSRVGKQANQSA